MPRTVVVVLAVLAETVVSFSVEAVLSPVSDVERSEETFSSVCVVVVSNVVVIVVAAVVVWVVVVTISPETEFSQPNRINVSVSIERKTQNFFTESPPNRITMMTIEYHSGFAYASHKLWGVRIRI